MHHHEYYSFVDIGDFTIYRCIIGDYRIDIVGQHRIAITGQRFEQLEHCNSGESLCSFFVSTVTLRLQFFTNSTPNHKNFLIRLTSFINHII